MHKPLRWFIAVLFLVGAWVAYTQTPQAGKLALEKVKDDLYVISNDGGNVAAYLTDEGVIVVDDKFDADVAEMPRQDQERDRQAGEVRS
jgi:hypothetical protein